MAARTRVAVAVLALVCATAVARWDPVLEWSAVPPTPEDVANVTLAVYGMDGCYTTCDNGYLTAVRAPGRAACPLHDRGQYRAGGNPGDRRAVSVFTVGTYVSGRWDPWPLS